MKLNVQPSDITWNSTLTWPRNGNATGSVGYNTDRVGAHFNRTG